MTQDKARKRAIRKRMSKTGERYTSARRHVVKDPVPPGVDLGKSDEAIRRGSGKGWAEWLGILDDWGARRRAHKEIVEYLMERLGVSGWWAQTVTVGYERARKGRAPHQAVSGHFRVDVSKTFPVGVRQLFEAVTDARRRARWLEPRTLRARTEQPGKSARFDFRDGTSRVQAYFESKGPAKSTLTIAHERLAGSHAVEPTRAFWKERLGRLAVALRS